MLQEQGTRRRGPIFLGFISKFLGLMGGDQGAEAFYFFEAAYLLTIPKSFQVCSLVSTIYIDFLDSKVRIISQLPHHLVYEWGSIYS